MCVEKAIGKGRLVRLTIKLKDNIKVDSCRDTSKQNWMKPAFRRLVERFSRSVEFHNNKNCFALFPSVSFFSVIYLLHFLSFFHFIPFQYLSSLFLRARAMRVLRSEDY